MQGIIYLEITEPTMASHISLEIKGGEKAGFTRYWSESTFDEEGKAVNVDHVDKLKYAKKFLEYKGNVFDIPGGCLAPGLYSIEF